MDGVPIMRMQNVQYNIAGKRVLDGISFAVQRGEILGIVGESGSGKSTLARLLMRLYQPCTGHIWFEQTNISTQSERVLRRSFRPYVQMIFQDPLATLNPRQTIRRIIEEPLLVQGRLNKHKRLLCITKWLKTVGLSTDMLNRFPHQLSGGQRQRVNIARAMSIEPDLLIADECFAALDVSIQAQMITLFQQMQRRFALTYVFISHDLRLIRYLCDRVGVIYDGSLVEIGNTADVFAAPRHSYTQHLLAGLPEHPRR